MFYQLVDLFKDAIFNGVYPSSLSQYLVEMVAFICIATVVAIPFLIVYAVWKRWL